MKRNIAANPKTTAQLGELVVAAFDGAARYSRDPLEVARLATRAVIHMLRRARVSSTPHKPLMRPRLVPGA